MHVLAVEAVGQFVGVGLADHAGAGREQALDRGSGARRRRMRLEPQRIAVAGAMPGDIEHVLDRKGQAAQRAIRRSSQFDMVVAAEGVERIVRNHCGRCMLAGCARDSLAAAFEGVKHRRELGNSHFRARRIEHDEIGGFADRQAHSREAASAAPDAA